MVKFNPFFGGVILFKNAVLFFFLFSFVSLKSDIALDIQSELVTIKGVNPLINANTCNYSYRETDLSDLPHLKQLCVICDQVHSRYEVRTCDVLRSCWKQGPLSLQQQLDIALNTSLESLEIQGNLCEPLLEPFVCHPNLRVLKIRQKTNVFDFPPRYYDAQPVRFQYVEVLTNYIREVLAQIPHLKELKIENLAIKNFDAASFSLLSELESLTLQIPKTIQGIEEARLPKLKTLRIHGEQFPYLVRYTVNHFESWVRTITGIDQIDFSKVAPDLVDLSLIYTDISKDSLVSIAKLKNLRVLDVRYTKIKGADLAILANMPSIEIVHIEKGEALTKEDLQKIARDRFLKAMGSNP